MDVAPFRQHFSYLDYHIFAERPDGERGMHSLHLEHAGKAGPALLLQCHNDSHFALLRTAIGIESVDQGVWDAVNEANEGSTDVSRVWLGCLDEGTPFVGFAAAYLGQYDKATFADLVDKFLRDVRRVTKDERFTLASGLISENSSEKP